MIDISNFDWGWMDEPSIYYHISPSGEHIDIGQYHKDGMIKEIFERNLYEKIFEVESGDIVLDIGASVGPFTYSILHKNPKHVICIEPSEREFKTLVKNTIGHPVSWINKGISNTNKITHSNMLFGGESEMESITFEKLIDLYQLSKIDFIKTDCEGGEYHIFNEVNLDYIKKNVKKIVGEWHLNTPEFKNLFRTFRDSYLNLFNHFEVFSIDGIDIKWDLWNEHFIEYYSEVIIYIKN